MPTDRYSNNRGTTSNVYNIAPRSTVGPPVAPEGPFDKGDVIIDSIGDMYSCLLSGTPGTWRQYVDTTQALSYVLTAGRNAVVSDSYLRGPGNVPQNQAGYVLPFDCVVFAVGIATNGVETWDLEIRKNNIVAPIETINIIGVEKAIFTGLSALLDAGDEVQFYCNGNGISKPSVTCWVRAR